MANWQEDLKDLLATLGDDKKSFEQMAEKHPVLREGYLRQSDYDRVLNKVKEERKQEEEKLKANNASMADWRQWYEDSKPRYDAALKETDEEKQKRLALEAEKAGWDKQRLDYEARIALAAKDAEGNVDPAALQKNVDERIQAQLQTGKYVSQEAVNKMVQEEAQKLADVFIKNTLPEAMNYTLHMARFDRRYQEEFKRPFDDKGYAKYVSERQIKDPEEGYKAYTAEDRHKAELEAAKLAGKEEAKKEFSSQMVPGNGVTPSTQLGQLGPAQLYMQNQYPDKALETAKPGDGILARYAAQELRAEGKIAP